MKKRGQLTIIIFIAIIIVVVIILTYFLIRSSKTSQLDNEYWQTEDMRKKIDNLDFNLKDCIDSITKESLIIVGFQGGYYHPPRTRYNYEEFFLPYYYDKGFINIPTIKQVEEELEKYVNEKMPKCIESIKIDHLKISYSEPKTDVNIKYQDVSYIVDIKVKVESGKNSQTIELKDMKISHNSSLYEIYQVAEYITNSHKEDSEYYCISCVSEMAKQRGLSIYLFPILLDKDTTGIMIYENRTSISNPYTFLFLNRYNGLEETPKIKI